MKRTNFFTILFIVSLSFLVILFIFMVYSFPYSTYPDWMSEMWNHMGGMMGGTSDPYLGYFGVLFTILIAVVVVSVAALIYFLIFPELKIGQTKTQRNISEKKSKAQPIETIRKTLNSDEQKILEVLENHKGKYLQKYLGKEAGLSRLRTHRILARFTERGIVTLEKKGNTNEVKLEDWLKKT
jgi:membrane protein insertase Oxa1/YidC/SpoIIIJ